MNGLTLGDLSHSFMLQRRSTFLQDNLTRLTKELSSGQASDTALHLRGDFAPLADLERDLKLLSIQAQTAAETQFQAGSIQNALENVQNQTSDLSDTLVLASASITGEARRNLETEASSKLDSVISALNTTVSNRTIFSGTDVSGPALSSSETLLDGLKAAITGAATAEDVLNAATDYFDAPGGGFETDIYLGGTDNLSRVDLGSEETVSLDIRADSPVLRSVIKTLALTSLIHDLDTTLDTGEIKKLTQGLAEQALKSQDGITSLRADLGFAEERISAASVRTATELQATELARNSLLSVDPFKTATDLEAVQTQLETLYTIAARSSRLSLVNFL